MMSFCGTRVALLRVPVGSCKIMIHLGSVAVGLLTVLFGVYYSVARKSFKKKRNF